jgi:hypothetical protein
MVSNETTLENDEHRCVPEYESRGLKVEQQQMVIISTFQMYMLQGKNTAFSVCQHKLNAFQKHRLLL